jgi:GDP-4-dehydro-6-deoxy-D-mannose reductase
MKNEKLFSHFKGHSVLVTGSNGFVAGYLIPRLNELGAEVHGIDLQECPKFPGYTYHCCNLLSFNEMEAFIAQYRPSFVFHLASQSSVGTSWKHEWGTIEKNSKTTYNLFKALEKSALSVRLLLVSSMEVYGDHGKRKVTVSDDLRPANPYAVSKAMTEMIARKFQNSAIEFVIARSSNHTGPGRPETFFEAHVAKQFAEAKKAGRDSITLNVGNVDNIRDFSDVRDVVEKYILLACQGKAGTVYNVCSGVGTKLREIISMLEKYSGIAANVNVDNSRLRKNDIAYLAGVNNVRFKNRPLLETITDLYRFFLGQ